MTGKQKRARLQILIAVLAVITIVAAAFFIYTSDYYHADGSAAAALVSDSQGTVEQSDGDLVFIPASEPAAGLIFYPGGKVEYTAYAPLMRSLAEQCVQCVLMKMPFNLAVLDINAADGTAEKFPEIGSWYIGGHSLGGTMAASYALKHSGELDGLILLASYSTADLSESGLKVLSVYGSEDGVLNMNEYANDLANLPADTREIVINGGNHAGFGSYGAQSGDGAASIAPEEQVRQTSEKIISFISE